MQKRGRIVRSVGGLYEIATEDKCKISCRARGVFRKEEITPLVGDIVTVELDEHENAAISGIEARKNSLIRPPLANLDLLFAVIPSTRPEPDLYTADKLTAIATFYGIKTTVVVSKAKLAPEKAAEIAQIYRLAGFGVFITDSVEQSGIDDLQAYVEALAEGTVCAFAGPSGAGKSTLMNALFPSFALATGAVSEKIGRGKHTTREVTLFELGSGALIADTPGFTMLDFTRFDFFGKDDLPYTFPEIERALVGCRYTKCSHTKEEGCRVLEAIREGRIAESRHQSYRALYDILKTKHDWDKK